MFDYKLNRLRCDTCGKFMIQVPGSSGCFVPSSDISYEEHIDQCKSCTDKYGVPIPFQTVNRNICCWVHEGVYV